MTSMEAPPTPFSCNLFPCETMWSLKSYLPKYTKNSYEYCIYYIQIIHCRGAKSSSITVRRHSNYPACYHTVFSCGCGCGCGFERRDAWAVVKLSIDAAGHGAYAAGLLLALRASVFLEGLVSARLSAFSFFSSLSLAGDATRVRFGDLSAFLVSRPRLRDLRIR